MKETSRQLTSGSIRTKIFSLTIGLVLATIVILSYLAISSVENLGASADQISSQALTAQAETYLEQLTQKNAREYDQVLTRVLKDTQYLAGFIASVYEQDAAGTLTRFWKLEEHMTFGTEGQYANSPDDVTSVFLPATTSLDENARRDIELGAYLDLAMPAIMERNPDVVALYYATENEVTRYYPNINLGAVLPPDFTVTQRPWYLGSTSPQKIGSPYWSSPYVDATGKGLVTTAAQAVVDRNGKLLGVIGIDVTLNNLKSAVESMSVLGTGYTFMVDQDGAAIALPEQGYRDFLNRLPRVNEFATSLKEEPRVAMVLDRMTAGQLGFARLELDDRVLFIAYAPLQSTGWSLAAVVESKDILGVVSDLKTELVQNTRSLIYRQLLPFSVLILIAVVLISSILVDRIVRPVKEVATAIAGISQGDWDLSLQARSNDELGLLAQQFIEMKDRLRQVMADLEHEIATRTRALERKINQLQAALHVARESMKVRNLAQLLDQAVGLIGGQFGFYHVGIYLIDPNYEYVHLQAAFTSSGVALTDKERRYRINQNSIVGYVASTSAVYVTDVRADPLYSPDPDLPDTRSEIALPLRGSQQLLGVLDIHSRDENDFQPDEVNTLQNLADQLATAIENARFFQEFREGIRQVNLDEAEKGKQKMAVPGKPVQAYQYDLRGINPVLSKEPLTEPLAERKPPYRVPLRVRGETLAILDVWPEGDELPAQQINLLHELGERLGQAIESARLYQEAQTRATREQLLNQFISRLSTSLDLDSLLRNAVRELGQMPGVKEASFFVRTAKDSRRGNGGSQKITAAGPSEEG